MFLSKLFRSRGLHFSRAALIFGLLLSACQPDTTPTAVQPTAAATTSSVTATSAATAEATASGDAATEAPPATEVANPVVDGVEIPEAFTDPANKPRIALVRELGDGSFFQRFFAGATSQAEELGVELLDSTASGDQAKMIANLETAIAQQVDAIIIDHGRADALRPVVQKALDAGIKVVAFDSALNLPGVPEIEQDDLLIGLLLSRQLAVDSGGSAKVIYVNVNGFAPLDKRDQSWQSVKWRYPDLQEVAKVGAVSSSTSADTQTQVEAAIKANPDATYILTTYDEFAKGAVQAVTQAGLADKYRIYGVDINTDDIQVIIAPNSPWKATVATDSYNVGRLAVRAAAALIGGAEVDRYLLVPPVVITQDFLLANNVTDIEGLVEALPALGESPLVWNDWILALITRNGFQPPSAASSAGAGSVSVPDPSTYEQAVIPEAFTDPANKPRIALVRELGDGSFFQRFFAGATSQAEELGVELLDSTASGDQAKMIANLETAISQQVDAIIIDHGRADALRPVVQKALDAGIKVVAFDSALNLPGVPEIEQDDLLIGLLLSRQLAVDSGGSAEVIYVNVNGFAPLDKRDRSWQSVKWRYPDLLEVAKVGAVSSSTAADTQTQVEAAIKANPNATYILTTYDEFAKGAVQAVTQAGLADKYRIYGVDINTDDIQVIIAPNSPWKATVATDSYNVGRLAVRAAAALIGGAEVDRYLLVPPVVITQDFLLANNVTDIEGLVEALPALGESPLVWNDWIYKLIAQNK